MKITLTPEESENYFYNALCNGLSYIEGHGLEVQFKNSEYVAAKAKLEKTLINQSVCFEDVLMEILKQGNKLYLVDVEGGDDIVDITLQHVHERVQNTEPTHLMDMVNETDDVCTADVILQTVFLGSIIYG